MLPTKVLFVLKQRGEPYNQTVPGTKDWSNKSFTGLSNSVRYIVDILATLGIDAKSVQVVDNNAIWKEVKSFGPTHVIVEALWVVPSKFAILKQMFPNVKWNVRLHSEIPFIASEGIAMEWIFDYLKEGVSVSSNSLRMVGALEGVTGKNIPYTPNYYPLSPLQSRKGLPADNVIDVGCFGAIRPLKNQLTQAVAAILFADQMGVEMRFHINADRVEGNGLPILHNIQGLFANSKHQLIEHGWMDKANFFNVLKNMDLSMQVSFSETFNIVSADSAVLNVPLVVSPEVIWAASIFQADPTNVNDIVAKMDVAWAGRGSDLQKRNYQGLTAYDAASEVAWPIALRQM